jgi:hypothetical protein
VLGANFSMGAKIRLKTLNLIFLQLQR